MSNLHVSDSERKAQKRVGSAANIGLLIGLMCVLVGFFSLTLDQPAYRGVFDQEDWYYLPLGILLMVLSFLIRRRVAIALWVTIGFVALLVIALLGETALALSEGKVIAVGFVWRVILPAVLLIPLFQGIGAINTLNATPATPQV